MFLFSPVLAGGDFRALYGGLFAPRYLGSLLPLLVIGVVPSFCRLCIFDFFIVFVVIGVDDIDEANEAIAVVDTNEAIDVVTVVLMVFCGQDLEKWPICLQCQHCSFWPSTTTIMA